MKTDLDFNGFNRVVVNHEGEAWSPKRAYEVLGIIPEVGYMRGDGWALGAPKEFEDVAFRLWADQWKYKIRKPETKWTKL